MNVVSAFTAKHLLLTVLMLTITNIATAESDADLDFFETTFGYFSAELERAKEEGKKGILLFFELDDCPFCLRMRTTVLNQADVQKFFRRHFLIFSIDIEGQTEMVDFKGQEMTAKYFSDKINRVRGTPTISFFDLTGKRVARYIGATSGVEEFMWLGRYVIEAQYKKMPFVKYKRQMRQP